MTDSADGTDLDVIAESNTLLSNMDRQTLAAHALRVVDVLFREDDRHLKRVMSRVVEQTRRLREPS